MSSSEWLKEVQTHFNSKQLCLAFEMSKNNVLTFPTGSYGLDRILGIKGWPRGRIVELYGAESSGKSTMALQAIAMCQKNNGNAVYIDLEGSFDAKWAEINGIDLKKLLVAKPDSGEQAFTIINALIKTKLVDFIVVDSVAAMIPKNEIQNDIEEQAVGLHARLMSKGLRITQSALLQNPQPCVFFINQIRTKIGIAYGSNFTTTGGHALRFASSIRVELRRTEAIRDGNEITGYYIKATVIKNKLAAPMQSELLPFSFKHGFDQLTELIDQATKKGVLIKKGTWYYYDNQNLAQGTKALRQKLVDQSELRASITNALNAKFSSSSC